MSIGIVSCGEEGIPSTKEEAIRYLEKRDFLDPIPYLFYVHDGNHEMIDIFHLSQAEFLYSLDTFPFYNPLHFAILSRDTITIKKLLDFGFNPNATIAKMNMKGINLFVEGINATVAKKYKNNSEFVKIGPSIMMLSSQSGNLNCLSQAVNLNEPEIVKFLISNWDNSKGKLELYRDPNERGLIYLAIDNCHHEIVEILIENQLVNYLTIDNLLVRAIISNCKELMELALSKGVKSEDYADPKNGDYSPIQDVVRNGGVSPSFIKPLIDHGFDIDYRAAKNYHSNVPAISIACEVGNAEMVEELLKYNPNLNIIGDRYNEINPLIIAAKKSDLKIIKMLLDKGANKNLRNFSGKRAYDLIPKDKDELRELLK